MSFVEIFRSNAALLGLEILCALGAYVAIRANRSARFLSGEEVSSSRRFRLLRSVAQHRNLAILVPAIVVLAGRSLLLFWMPHPVPGVHDEFSYLLSGETFALGRLTNPPSPFWKNLETFHELQYPTFASMYPPAQGAFLALGIVLTGDPWAGVLISVAVLCAAACWMLQGWLPPEWALFGGLLTALRFGLAGYWINSYWGGAVAALGGMLVLGSAPRLFKRTRMTAALAFGAGTLLLENSRPYEGLVFVAAVLVWICFRLRTLARARARKILMQFGIPALCVIGLGQIAMLRYFAAVTGHALEMPYVLNAREYLFSRPFIWQRLQPEPVYRHAVMKRYYEQGTRSRYARLHTVSGFLLETGNKFRSALFFYTWPGILLMGLALRFAGKRPEIRLCCGLALVLFMALSLEEWPMQFHYAAPLASVALLATSVCLREIWRSRSWELAGSRLPVFLYVALCIFAVGARAGAAAMHVPFTSDGWIPWATDKPGNLAREQIVTSLKNSGGRHLVFVHYEQNHDPSSEWVFNSADLENAKIIWARQLSPEADAQMSNHFKDRTVWQIDPDRKPAQLACVSGPDHTILASSLEAGNGLPASNRDNPCETP